MIWIHNTLSSAWQLLLGTPTVPGVPGKSPALIEIVGVWELPLALLAIGLGIFVLRLNPQRALNRHLAAVLFVSAIWHIIFFLALRLHPGLPYLRLSNATATCIFICMALLYDCILHPFSSFNSRIGREKWILGICFFVFLTPFTGLWVPFTSMPDHPVNGALHPVIAIIQFLLPASLSLRALARLKQASSIQRIELQSFATLTIAVTLGASVMILARRYDRSLAHLGSVLYGCWYIFGTWMLVSPKVIRFSDLGLLAVRHSVNIAVCLALVTPVLVLGDNLTVRQLTVGIILIIYPGGMIANFITARYFSRSYDPVYDELRRKILDIVGSEWIESRLTRHFCDTISDQLAVGTVEAWNTLELPKKSISAARRQLVVAATKPGWMTVASAHRTLQPKELKLLLSAFEKEQVSLVLVDYSTTGPWALMIGQQSSLRIFTDLEIRFLREMLVLLRGASERIRLAGKAAHNDRLATVGFLASQMRHEDRNRLDSIRAGLELLKLGRECDLNQEHRELLYQTVEDFAHDFNLSLDLARSDFGRIEVASAHAVIRDSIGVFTPLARRRTVTIETFFTSDPDAVKIDQRLLRQVLLNLMRNATEATGTADGGQIAIKTSSIDTVFLIEVADNGPGVAAAIYDQLFTDFCTTKPTGTGIGLSICRDALSLMNGTIHYLTPKGEPHARFIIGIPTASSGGNAGVPCGGCTLPEFGL